MSFSYFPSNKAAGKMVLVDDAGGGVKYIGEAEVGTSTALPFWAIKKLTQTGDDIAITWADGDSNYDNIWDNRVSLTYS